MVKHGQDLLDFILGLNKLLFVEFSLLKQMDSSLLVRIIRVKKLQAQRLKIVTQSFIRGSHSASSWQLTSYDLVNKYFHTEQKCY